VKDVLNSFSACLFWAVLAFGVFVLALFFWRSL
jgi:hypothetical protein